MSEGGGPPEAGRDAGGRVQVYFYGDYVCPFSYVEDARVREVVRGEEGVDLHWRPLPIHPAVPSDGLPADELGYAPDEWSRIRREVREQAEAAGVPLEMPDFVANSRGALQAAEFAKDVAPDAFRRVHRALFQAFFVDGRNLGETAVLLDVCEEAGLDRRALETALEDDRYAEELAIAEREASRYGIEGTPTVLFGRHKVVGAAPSDVLRDALDRAGRDAAPGRTPAGEGAAESPGDEVSSGEESAGDGS